MVVLTYLLEANFYLLIFVGFYYITLRNQSFHNLNRFYLLFTSIISFLLPFIKISGFGSEVLQENVSYQDIELLNDKLNQDTTIWNSSVIAIAIYLAVSSFLLLKFCTKVFRIIYLLKNSKYERKGNVKWIIIPDETAFSFFNYLFVNPNSSGIETIEKHEMVHIAQLHSIDIILFEIISIINWINPLSIWLKIEIKLVHEYIADEQTLTGGIDRDDYSAFLISVSSFDDSTSLGSKIASKTLLEQRLICLYSVGSSKKQRLRYLLFLPLLMIAATVSTFAFEKKIAIVNLIWSPVESLPGDEQLEVPPSDFRINEKRNAAIPGNLDRDQKQSSQTYKKTSTESFKTRVSPKSVAERSFAVYINTTTDTVKIRRTESPLNAKEYKGIYVINSKIYTHKQLGKAMEPNGQLDIVLPERPIIGMFTENDDQAISRWGRKAAKGVVFVQLKN